MEELILVAERDSDMPAHRNRSIGLSIRC